MFRKLSLAQLYVYVQPSIQCLYFIEVHKLYVRTHVKITLLWTCTISELILVRQQEGM